MVLNDAFLKSIRPCGYGPRGSVGFEVKFCRSAYSDDLFEKSDIPFPDHLINANDKRRAEYLAGRIAALHALCDLGSETTPVGTGLHGAPQWPEGYIGSISHTNSIAHAIVSKSPGYMLGVDIEEIIDSKTAGSISRIVFSQREMDVLKGFSGGLMLAVTIAFSSKESVFKAVYPCVKLLFGFDVVHVISINEPKRCVRLMLAESLCKRLTSGFVFDVHYLHNETHAISYFFCSTP